MSKSSKGKGFESCQDLNLSVQLPLEANYTHFILDNYHKNVKNKDLEVIASTCKEKNNTRFNKEERLGNNKRLDLVSNELIISAGHSRTFRPRCNKNLAEESSSQVPHSPQHPETKSPQRQNDLKAAHSNTKPFKCNCCNKLFSKRKRMTQHQLLHKKKPFKCEDCDRCFSHEEKLVIHQAKHSGGKPFVCEVCKKCFTKKYILDGHLVVHFGEKQFKCDVCDYYFTRRSDLLRHHRVIHSEPTEEFKCDSCDKTFINKSYLARHQVLHSGEKPFQCSICDKTFSRKQYLVDHQSVHTGERPFECAVCNKYFTKRSSLVSHQALHLGVKPFQCLTCNKSFSHKSNLVAHKKTHR